MDRPPGVRHQMHFSATTSNPGADFASIGGDVMGEFGRMPVHNGRFTDFTSAPMMRHQADAEIRRRMRSSF
jgi:hypothetical protein